MSATPLLTSHLSTGQLTGSARSPRVPRTDRPQPATDARGAAVVDPVDHRTRSVGVALPERLTRYVGGLCSATIQVIRLADGRQARTDLIRLNPTVEAYSLDLDAPAPAAVSHYRASDRGATALRRTSPAVGRMVAGSFPRVPLPELSARVRAAGHPLGGADLREHEAIAATQAALWHLTNGVDLDTRPRSIPRRLAAGTADGSRTSLDPASPSWAGTISAGRPLTIDIGFDDRPQLGGYHLGLAGVPAAHRLEVRLERSLDGHHWQPVAGSERTVGPRGTHGPGPTVRHAALDTTLGVGATLADGWGRGFPYYRLRLETSSPAPVGLGLDGLRFTLTGTSTYANPDRIVHLYHYLLGTVAAPAGPREARPTRLRLTHAGSGIVRPPVAGALGPFVVTGTDPSDRVAVDLPDSPSASVMDCWGRPLTRGIRPAELFFVAGGDGPVRGRLIVETTRTDGCAPRVLLGSRTYDGPADCTPLLHGSPAVRQETSTFRLEALHAAHMRAAAPPRADDAQRGA